MKSHAAILLGLALGLTLGVAAWATQAAVLIWAVRILEPIGTVFVNLLRMAVIPLVVTALYGGVARLGDPRRLGKLTGLALAFFWVSTVIAITIGFASARVVLPLAPLSPAGRAELAAAPVDSSLVAAAAGASKSLVQVIVDMIPPNPVAAAANGDLLPLVVFALIAALATAALPRERREQLVGLADAITAVLIQVVHWALWLAPVGVAGLIAPLGLRFGWSMLGTIGAFVGAVILGLVAFVAVIYLPALVWRTAVTVAGLAREGAAALAMAFSSTSQVASLPLMLDAADRLSLPRSVAGLVLPLGATLNRAGSALFQSVALLFLAEVYGVGISAGGYVTALVAVFLASLTVASVPAASVLSLAPALSATGVPLAGLGILLGVDRIPDMFRTAVNAAGTLVGTAFVARAVARPSASHEGALSPAGDPAGAA